MTGDPGGAQCPGHPRPGDGSGQDRATFSALLEDNAEDLYEHAPCGYLSTLLDGQIAKINTTLLDWLGYSRAELVGRRRFADLLTIGGKLYHETHFAPLLRMQGEIGGVALELAAADGARLPVLVTSTIKTGADGEPLLIRTTVFDARDRRTYERELLRARQEADAARERADRERDQVQRLATTLQRSLLPPRLAEVPGVEVAAHYHPASVSEVGGDFYDLFPIADGQWAFFLGDVCGKGSDAAALTSLTRYTLRSATVYDPDPVAVLHNLNSVLLQEYRSELPAFCTVIFGLLTVDEGDAVITLASGGHPPALLLHSNGRCAYRPTPGGQLVGVLHDPVFGTTTLRLGSGDTLLLYTDGLTEARTGTARSRYDEAALLEFTSALAPIGAPALVGEVVDLLARFGDGLEDDAAILALGVPAGPGGAPR
ncbi:PP2C family protein-serine/threonine phosphatase [Pseudonocardia spinosispora]|uniref:PP2C family protein-serine/threonine phosphatase n=1 Tax=Pseudonocardia spinosispora TaxID=103441 RepID=UPI00041FAADC|nr:SpoIIE family protein phosphatase [Pseudonocardia spinosispora]